MRDELQHTRLFADTLLRNDPHFFLLKLHKLQRQYDD